MPHRNWTTWVTNASDISIYDYYGNIGIGTTIPNHTLDVYGDINTNTSYYMVGNDVWQYMITSAWAAGQVWSSNGAGQWSRANSMGGEATDLVLVSLVFIGGVWSISDTQVLFTTNSSHIWINAVLNSYGIVTTYPPTYYWLSLGFNWYNLDSHEIISATYIAWNSTDAVLKLVLGDRDGNNRIEFTMSDDATTNTLVWPDRLMILFAAPGPYN